MPPQGWELLVESCSLGRGEQHPIEAYSEFMPPVRLGCGAYDQRPDRFFTEEDPFGFPVTESEEAFQLRPGFEDIARQVFGAFQRLVHGQSAEGLGKNTLLDNPYWPPELSSRAGGLRHERFVFILPLALSLTQDDKGRKRWTLFGGSEQGPSRPFWKSFFTCPGREIPAERAIGLLKTLLAASYGEPAETLGNLHKVGFRIFARDGDPEKTLRPAWTLAFIWTQGMPLKGVKYLLSFEPFRNLPETVTKAYLAGELHLIPFPGSLLLWGVPGYVKMQRELPAANQIPLLNLVQRHEAPHGIRVPQSGWIHIAHPDSASGHQDFGPIRSTFRRTHRWAKVHRYEDELSFAGPMDHVLHVLFSTAPDDLGLYGKPMARNSQIWTQHHRLLLDGPNAAKKEIQAAFETIKKGGLFGYRFQYPPMCVGSYQLYWHRPLIAYLLADKGEPALLPDLLSGYVTSEPVKNPDLTDSVELWPRFCERNIHKTVIELFKDKKHQHKTITRVLNLLTAHELFEGKNLPRSFARQIMMLPERKTLDEWLTSLPGLAEDEKRGGWLETRLRDLIEQPEPIPTSDGKGAPASMTFCYSALRSFEVRFWRDIAYLSGGRYLTQANSDCSLDPVTQKALTHHHRDLEKFGDYLLGYYQRTIASMGMEGKALIGDLPFRWKTDFDFDWWEGWVRNQERLTEERNLMVVIPGRDRQRAILMADHYDTAYMEDLYYKDRGGSGARLAASGADDNHSATAALMRAAPIFCHLSREGKLGCDIWLVHLTGEEFPSDCLGARQLCQELIENRLKLRLIQGGEQDLSNVQIQGVYVLDMVAHNNDHNRYKFQISPGRGIEATRLAYQAHLANEIWNASTPVWNRRPSRRHRGGGNRSSSKTIIPVIATFPKLDGEIRLPQDPLSTLYNTDGQIFSDAGVPVTLLMEDYDLHRKGYHDSRDTMANIDLDYGAGLVAIAIETVARAATEKP